jgi:IclR family pca regulon transcriptional regulator
MERRRAAGTADPTISVREDDPEFLLTLERGLLVLRAFDHDHPEMPLSEVAQATGLSPAVARRCLNTLVKLGYMRKIGRRFVLTPEVLVFASSYLGAMNFEELAAPHLQAVRDASGDSSSMAVLSGSEVLYVVHVSTKRPIRLASSVGTRFPIHATSLGRVLMAFQPDEVMEAYLAQAPFERRTEHTITDASVLRGRFGEIRQRFYDTAEDELDYGIVSLSVPIFDPRGQIVAAINCSTSTARIARQALISERLPILQLAKRNIEHALRRWPFLIHSVGGGGIV